VDGWQGFIERYSIDIGYLLVFAYEGRSNFIVYIFRTAELDYQSAMISRVKRPFYEICHHIFEGIEDIDSFDFLDSAPSNPTGALQGKDSTGCMDQYQRRIISNKDKKIRIPRKLQERSGNQI